MEAMMHATTKPKLPECKICKQSFHTNVKLVKHSLKTSHGADRCCVPCSRIFGTTEGLEAHTKSSAHVIPSSIAPKNKPPKVTLSSKPPTVNNRQECSICHRFFQTKAQLTEHCLHSGHGEDRCCRPCLRHFGTKEALEAHEKSSACKGSTCQDFKTSSPPAWQQEQFINCRGNSYRRIPQQDHNAVLQKLLSQCHSMSILQRHGYNTSDQQRDGASQLTHGTGEEILPLPQNDPSRNARKAVAIDCEMVGVECGASELVSLTVVDFLTGEQIIHSLVKPRRPVVDWRTNIHGISPAVLTIAHPKGLTLDGWQTARAELFKHVDQNTVLVGHSLNYDLAVLHIHPGRVVDSIILASDAIFSKKKGKPRYWGLGLKDVCSGLLDLKIRENDDRGNSKVHDALEDALAAREVVLCCLEQPSAYNGWVTEKRKAFFWSSDTQRISKAAASAQTTRRPEGKGK